MLRPGTAKPAFLGRDGLRTRLGGVATLSGLFFLLTLSLAIGARSLGLHGIFHSVFRFNGSADDVVVVYLRIPRVLLALLVGTGLGVAGAILQGLTRNPLAEPAVLGINSGAALALVVASSCLHEHALLWRVPIAFCGAITAVLLVHILERLTKRRTFASLLILGSVLGGLMASITTTILLCTGHDFTSVLYWLVGSLNGSDWALVFLALPLILAGLLLSVALPFRLNVLRLGTDIANGLGVDVLSTETLGMMAVVLMTAAAVACVGPIGFVGLLAAHLARMIVGSDYRWVLPGSAVIGGALLLLCDLLARTCLWVSYDEIPVGLVTACVGAPLLLILMRMRTVQST